MTARRERDPLKIPVQLNVRVSFERREHLIDVAENRGLSLNQLVSDALDTLFPLHHGVASVDEAQ